MNTNARAQLSALFILGATLSACEEYRNGGVPMAPCTVGEAERELQQGLMVLRPEIELISGSLRCRPGKSQACEQLLAEECVTTLGDVAVGDVARHEVAILNPSSIDLRVVDVRVESDSCLDVYLATILEGDLFVQARASRNVELVVRPTEVGACTFNFTVESDGGNTNETTSLRIDADRVAGAVEEGCRTEGTCCCSTSVAPSSPSCSTGHLQCDNGTPQFGAEDCPGETCVQ